MEKVKQIIQYVLPQLITAGDYAKEIQKRIVNNNSKSETNNFFAEALTDADLSIQNFIEICLLAKFPEIGFYGEEYASSLNQKYFQNKEELTILLDPVDGTRIYKDGHRGFSIILSIIDQESFLASVIYFPVDQKTYLAIKDVGAFELTEEDMRFGRWNSKIKLANSSQLIRTFNQEKLSKKLKENYPTYDVLAEYTLEDSGFGNEQIFTGEIGSLFYTNAQFIDVAAFAFIVQEAGGIVTDLEGKKLPKLSKTMDYIFPTLLASSDNDFHKKVLNSIYENKELINY